MNGKTQEDAVAILRGIVIGSLVNLVVSRQNETLPRKLKDDPVTDKVIREENVKEFFMFEIPLNDTGSAGLGISLKGNQSKKSGKDLGIFVKAIFHGGAAWQDGRLKVNDQLVKVNGHSMTGATNREAIDILRTSMSNEGNIRGLIQMVVARRHPTSSRVSSEASSDLSDSILDQLSTRSANELTIDDTRSRMMDEDEPLDLSQTRSTSPINPDVVMVDDDWPNVSDPFNRESVTRQSMSEKRKDPIPRLPFNVEGKSNKDVEGKSNKDKDSTTPYSSKQTNNNNSRNFGSNVPQPMTLKKSVSTESLLTANTLHSNCMQGRQEKKADQVDVGPTLGIAKSSSLESLQSAVEKCYVEDKLDAGYP
uniref:PDZ domain-containing protein n=1 Tax=Ciona intestinalis TaxID=7719 RepID=F6SA56_CIOIN